MEVLDKAAALFASRGYAATSLQDIANEVGLSRTSIYYYFTSKEALLEELVRGVTQWPAKIFSELDGTGESETERVAEAACQLVLWVTDPHTHFKLLDRAESDLPDQLAAAHRATKREVLNGLVGLVNRGINAGEFRPVDARLAAFAILGMCNWTAWWLSPTGSLSRKEVAVGISQLAVAMVRKSAGTGLLQDAKSITAAIRENLDMLDLLHGQDRQAPMRQSTGQGIGRAAKVRSAR